MSSTAAVSHIQTTKSFFVIQENDSKLTKVMKVALRVLFPIGTLVGIITLGIDFSRYIAQKLTDRKITVVLTPTDTQPAPEPQIIDRPESSTAANSGRDARRSFVSSAVHTTASIVGRLSGYSDFKTAANRFRDHQWTSGIGHALKGAAKAAVVVGVTYAASCAISTALAHNQPNCERICNERRRYEYLEATHFDYTVRSRSNCEEFLARVHPQDKCDCHRMCAGIYNQAAAHAQDKRDCEELLERGFEGFVRDCSLDKRGILSVPSLDPSHYRLDSWGVSHCEATLTKTGTELVKRSLPQPFLEVYQSLCDLASDNPEELAKGSLPQPFFQVVCHRAYVHLANKCWGTKLTTAHVKNY